MGKVQRVGPEAAESLARAYNRRFIDDETLYERLTDGTKRRCREPINGLSEIRDVAWFEHELGSRYSISLAIQDDADHTTAYCVFKLLEGHDLLAVCKSEFGGNATLHDHIRDQDEIVAALKNRRLYCLSEIGSRSRAHAAALVRKAADLPEFHDTYILADMLHGVELGPCSQLGGNDPVAQLANNLHFDNIGSSVKQRAIKVRHESPRCALFGDRGVQQSDGFVEFKVDLIFRIYGASSGAISTRIKSKFQ